MTDATFQLETPSDSYLTPPSAAGAVVDAILQDARYACRRLRQAPGFTLVVVLTLALGIGANSAIFSVVNTVLLAPLPYRDPGRLVTIYHYYPVQQMQAPVSAPGYQDYRDRTHSFASVAVESGWRANITGAGEPQALVGKKVTGSFFTTLGVTPLLGRALLPDDEAVHGHVVVISDGLWLRDFGGEPGVIGRTATLNGEGYQIVGVMPASFVDPWTTTAEVWAPMSLTPAQLSTNNYTNEYLNLTARLKPGVPVSTAAAEMTAFASQLKRAAPANFSADWTLQVVSMADVQTGKIRPALLLLLGAVGFVLLIACANVANLLLARAASRTREVAVRTALGARPRDLVRQLLVESLILSLVGAAVGLVIAYASVKALVTAGPANIPRVGEIAIDGRVALFTLAIALMTGAVFGLVPAAQLWRTNLQGALKDGSRGGTHDRAGQRVRKSLVVAEVALALTLLTGGGLLLKSFAKLAQVSPGFTSYHVLTFGVALPAARYRSDTTSIAFWDALLPALSRVPGVESAGATSVVPFGGNWATTSYNVEGYTPPPHANGPWGDVRLITPGFLHAMEIPLLKGRQFAASDDAHGSLVAVVDQEFVKHYLPAGANPIGHRLFFGNFPADSTTQYITIVGVVAHTKHESLDAAPRPQLYTPVAQSLGNNAPNRLDVVVRTTGDPLAVVPALRAAVHALDRDLPISKVATLDDLIAQSMAQRRLSALLLGIFSGLALLLASLGLYGVMAYAVAQRTREMGVRVALGASRQNVLGLVVRQGMALAAIGTVIGLVGALAVTRLLGTQLYDVSPTDPATFAGVTLLLVVVAIVATLVPALRATRVDPVIALRQE
ncbi:MAG TPA: ABC transporter permease [Gemmatimonadales bacterium]